MVDVVLWGPPQRISSKPHPVAINGVVYRVSVWSPSTQPEDVVAHLEALGFDVERLEDEE